ncbi:phage antirepressor KilAC domain-containing protein [Falsiroseomonas sp.]|uniref:phage antirepressor KilAC domain-containing protein n=1 Tax=Falsiroseomonas sp. TaxID=2870721 RepID=UPI0027356AE4|nr:phage antirepressor KilAC domain-containing protein [Falsiroseomonas sp.]MDP3417846.1 phage antirepressor KilAC domain-containing protein [Falsiroseomonas sp.]
MSDYNVGHLLPVSNAKIGEAAVQTVDGRTLHAFLKVGKDFTTWMKDRIATYGFAEGLDYVTDLLPNFGEKGHGRPSKAYHLSLDMAKELAMVERNAEGRRARLYFIECERRAKAPPVRAVMTDEEVMARGLLVASRRVEELAAKVANLTPKAEALDRIATADGSLSITETAKALQVRPKDLFAWLQQNGWIYKRPGGAAFLGYQSRITSGLVEHKVTEVSRSDGSSKVVEQVRITPKGLTKLAGQMPGAALDASVSSAGALAAVTGSAH